MDDLIAFVRARLDEDEAAARPLEHSWVTAADPLTAAFSHRFDAKRMLREMEAKRQRLALYLGAREALAAALKDAPALDDPATAHGYVRERINVNRASGHFAALEMSVRFDAVTWCDHPGFRPEWRP